MTAPLVNQTVFYKVVFGGDIGAAIVPVYNATLFEAPVWIYAQRVIRL